MERRQQAARDLARIYEQARYAPENEPLDEAGVARHQRGLGARPAGRLRPLPGQRGAHILDDSYSAAIKFCTLA